MLNLMIFIIIGVYSYQTNWMGGPGLLGPVVDWGNKYYQNNNVTVAIPGQVSLVATHGGGLGWFENQNLSWVWHSINNSIGYNKVWAVDVDADSNFTETFHANYVNGGADFDGMWPSDIDMDGDEDVVCGGGLYAPYVFYALFNDGTGYNFSFNVLSGTNTQGMGERYTDGAIARDLDLDGLPDIAGTLTRVGWFRQDSPLSFSLYDIDDVEYSHWIYAEPLGGCVPRPDLFVTDEGAHIVYENKMAQAFATYGYLQSSILRLETAQMCSLKYFGYIACVPNDTALSFYWRTGVDSADIVNNPWNGPHFAIIGIPEVTDSFWVGTNNKRMFQYMAEFRSDGDIAVLYKVWLTYECSPFGVNEVDDVDKFKLYLERDNIVIVAKESGNVALKIYDAAGRLFRILFNGFLASGTYKFGINEVTGIWFIRLSYKGNSKSLKLIKIGNEIISPVRGG